MALNLPAHIAAASTSPTQVSVPQDKLDAVRDAIRALRDLERRKADLAEQLAEINKSILSYQFTKLVDLFTETRVDSLGLEAEGNLPAYDAEKTQLYSAKIPEDKERDAADWFEENGHGDLVKATFTVAFGMGEIETARSFEKLLEEKDVDYSSRVGIHPQTLLAFVTKEMKADHILPMTLLGAKVVDMVKLKERRQKLRK